MRRRLLGLGAALVVMFLLIDVGATLFFVPGYWRPLPPFGAITNERQAAWLERAQARIAGEAEPVGIGRFDSALGWAYREGSQNHDGTVHISDRGFRGVREVGEEPPEGKLRIAAFGDSFTFCADVADDETWESQLEEMAPQFEVLNLGVGGYGTDQAILRAKRQLDGLNADVAFLGLLLENIGRNVNRYRPRWYPNADSPVVKPRYTFHQDELWVVPHGINTEAQLVEMITDGSILRVMEPYEYWVDDYVMPPLRWSSVARFLASRRAYEERSLERLWTDVEGEPFRITVALAERFCQFAKNAELEFAAILVFPGREDLDRYDQTGTKYWDVVFPELDARGLPYLDMSEALLAAKREGVELYGNRHHLTIEGNAVVARALLEALEQLELGTK